MDLGYIALNTLIYGILALALAGCLAYAKVLNLSVGGFVVAIAYLLVDIISNGISAQTIIIAVAIVLVRRLMHHILLTHFPHAKQRDHVGLVITLGVGVLLENGVNYIYGPNSVSIDILTLSPMTLIITVVVLSAIFYYVFQKTLLGSIFHGLYENSASIRSLGVATNTLLQKYFICLLVMLALVSLIVINESAMRPSDGLFYLIKGIGIMILVGIQQKQRMMLGALVYVVLEYLLFITRGLPIAYKESLVLAIILVVLIIKPEGLFALGKRKI